MFSTAYGNVGSSIYYALGLVTVYALGATPIAFFISGVIFFFTAVTYAEATARFPEAGGSASFTRHAFNEAVSFFAGWAQMLNYTVTIAISAIFVPHYLAKFWPSGGLIGHPNDIYGGAIVVLFLVVLNIVGVKEAASLNIFLALADLATQALLVIIGLFAVFTPHPAGQPDRAGAPSRPGATSSSRFRWRWWPTPVSRRSRTCRRRRSIRPGTSRGRSCTWCWRCSRSTRSCRRWRSRRCR